MSSATQVQAMNRPQCVPDVAARVHRGAAVRATYLGLNRLALLLLAAQALLLLVVAVLVPLLGLTVDWSSTYLFLATHAVLVVIWLYFFKVPGRPHEWKIPDTLFAFLLVMQMGQLVAIAQYPAAALNRPIIDPWLAAADARLGFHVPALAEWTRANPTAQMLLDRAYFSLVPQFTLTIPLLGLVFRYRNELWEYLFHFHFCALFTLISFAVFPAACAFTYYGFESAFDQSRFIAHFEQVRSGALTVIALDNLEGLVSMPSFHAAGGLMVTWAFRRRSAMLCLLVPLNAGLIAATFMSGAHYVVDTLATGLMFVLSAFIYRRWVTRLLEPLPADRSARDVAP
jgi:hypothetical protein